MEVIKPLTPEERAQLVACEASVDLVSYVEAPYTAVTFNIKRNPF